MKLLYCPSCDDVFKLDYQPRICKCGDVIGHYFEDGLTAVYSKNGIPLGFNNSSLIEAINNQPESGMGKNFTAFVIPKQCPTMRVY
jgi:hypothetical protein